MSEEKVKVGAYSGHREEEVPRKIVVHEREIDVVEILKRWIAEGLEDRTIKRFFKVKGSDGAVHEIYCDEWKMEWFLRG